MPPASTLLRLVGFVVPCVLLLAGLWLGGYPGAAILAVATGLFTVAFSYRRRHRVWRCVRRCATTGPRERKHDLKSRETYGPVRVYLERDASRY